MRKLPHFAAALVLVILAAIFSIKSFSPATDATVSAPVVTISVEEIQRFIDFKTLPVEQVKDPI